MQFEVFPNPIVRARRVFPYVAVLQSNIADTNRDRVVAPLSAEPDALRMAKRLIPKVRVQGADFALVVPSLASVPADSLQGSVGSIARHRDAVTAALDYLFQGI
ncbi:CcdB family protein [Azospirillum sp.]|uniref:CcdB family protein n=1 Tax=Azospirillum sp. TaxID=34012 RepID=UPI002D6C756B|nr:CcdB family protein [Azospirillum sp.]HYD65799.1 CcdB family protein [Azospirillum sp.]